MGKMVARITGGTSNNASRKERWASTELAKHHAETILSRWTKTDSPSVNMREAGERTIAEATVAAAAKCRVNGQCWTGRKAFQGRPIKTVPAARLPSPSNNRADRPTGL